MTASKTAFGGSRGQNIYLIDPAMLVFDSVPDHRASLDSPDELEGLVLSVMDVGILDPLLVHNDGGRARIISGNRRGRALQEANRRRVEAGLEPLPCPVVSRKGEELLLEQLAITANVQRRDLTLAEKIRACASLANGGTPEGRLCATFGKGISTIRQWLAVADTAPEVMTALGEHRIQMTRILTDIVPLPRAEQPARLAEILDQIGTAVEEEERDHGQPIAAPSPARKRLSSGRPGLGALKKLHAANVLPAQVALALGWVVGRVRTKDFLEAFPRAGEVVKKGKR